MRRSSGSWTSNIMVLSDRYVLRTSPWPDRTVISSASACWISTRTR